MKKTINTMLLLMLFCIQTFLFQACTTGGNGDPPGGDDCNPGTSQECGPCPLGLKGTQVCNADGESWSECDCPTSTVAVETNNADAEFTVTDSIGNVFTGQGESAIFSGVTPGNISIAYGPIHGYCTPGFGSRAVGAGNTVKFEAEYRKGCDSYIIINTNHKEASFLLLGPETYYGNGTHWEMLGVPDGSYTIIFNDVSDTCYIPPSTVTKTAIEGSPLFLNENYELDASCTSPSLVTWYRDEDGDRFSDGYIEVSEGRPGITFFTYDELISTFGDCDDSNKDIHPGAVDVPGNGIDEDCSDTTIGYEEYTASDYFPIETGSTWVFQSNADDITQKVSNETHNFSGIMGTRFEGSSGTCVNRDLYYVADDQGVAIVGAYDADKEEYVDTGRMVMIPAEVKVGESWTVIGTVSMTATGTLLGLENISVPTSPAMELKKCLKIQFTVDSDEGSFTDIYWYAKHVGIVKIERISQDPLDYEGCMTATADNPLLELKSIDGVGYSASDLEGTWMGSITVYKDDGETGVLDDGGWSFDSEGNAIEWIGANAVSIDGELGVSLSGEISGTLLGVNEIDAEKGIQDTTTMNIQGNLTSKTSMNIVLYCSFTRSDGSKEGSYTAIGTSTKQPAHD